MLFGNCSQFDMRARLHAELLSAGCSSCAAFGPHRLLPLQMEAELMELNKEAMKQLVQKETPVRAYIANVHKTLLKGYEGVLGDKPSQHESLFSLRAVGCFQSGLHQQVCSQPLLKYTTLLAFCVDKRVSCDFVTHVAAPRPNNLVNILLVYSLNFGEFALFVRMKGFAVS